MPATIRRNLTLGEYDVKTLPSGRQARPNDCCLSVGRVVFSVKFVKKNGELCFISRGVVSALPFSVSGNRMRGLMPVDESLNILRIENPDGWTVETSGRTFQGIFPQPYRIFLTTGRPHRRKPGVSHFWLPAITMTSDIF